MKAVRDDWKASLAEGRLGPFSAAAACIGIYCVVQVAVLTLLVRAAGTGVGIDDAEQLVYLPYLWAGYGGSQPPLYTWINWLATSLLGVDILTLKLVKYACLLAAALCVRRAMRLLGFLPVTASTAAFGLFLIPQFFWESQRALSHSVAAVCFCAVAFLALVYLHSRRSAASYAIFGLAMATAMLAKYNDLVFLGCLLAAALSLRDFRTAILDRRFLVSIAVAVLAIAPTLLWNAHHPDELLARTYKFGIGPDGRSWSAAVRGLMELAHSVFNFSILPVIILLAAAATTWRRPMQSPRPATSAERLLWRTLALGVVVVAVFMVAAGATGSRDRWFLPILFLLPAAASASMERFGAWGRAAQLATIRGAVVIVAFATPALWFTQIYAGDGQSGIARLDYRALERALVSDGPVKTVLSDWLWIGNLRLVDPDLVLLGDEVPDFIGLIREPAVLTWIDKPAPDKAMMARLSRAGYIVDGPEKTLVIHEKVGDGARQIRFVRLKRAGSSVLEPNPKPLRPAEANQ